MSRGFIFVCKNSFEEIQEKVADLCLDSSPHPTSDDCIYFAMTEEDGVYPTICISPDERDDNNPNDISTYKEFKDALLLYRQKILKDDLDEYQGFCLGVLCDLNYVSKFLCRLDDVNIMINFPRIIVFDQIKDQVIKNDYQCDWYWNEDEFCVPLPDDWEEKFDEILPPIF